MAENVAPEPSYAVVLLVEQSLTGADARQIRELHAGVSEPVEYHVLLPIEDAAARIESAMGSLSSGEYLGSPAAMIEGVDIDAVREDCQQRAQAELDSAVEVLRDAGAAVQGRLVDDPIRALQAVVSEVGGREAIVLTRPHVVAEFFHVDWCAQARRHLDIPVLHLLEQETSEEE